MRTLIVVPFYNEESSLARTLNGVVSNIKYAKDCLAIDDGSTDSSFKAASRIKGITLLRNEVNLGKGAAIKEGARYALEHNYDSIITLDSDGQHDPSLIRDFISEEKKTHADIVIGFRQKRKDMPIQRKATNSISSSFISLVCGTEIKDSQCGYRLIKTMVFKEIPLFDDRFGLETEILIKACRNGYKISNIPISTTYTTRKRRFPLLQVMNIAWIIIESIFSKRQAITRKKHKSE